MQALLFGAWVRKLLVGRKPLKMFRVDQEKLKDYSQGKGERYLELSFELQNYIIMLFSGVLDK